MVRTGAILAAAASAGAVVLAGGPAYADLADWEVNEVVASVDGDPAIRFLELTNTVGGCLFPTSRVDIRDADGALVAAVPLVTATTCFEAGWFLFVATPEASAHFGIPIDGALVAPVDPTAGQVCFASSGTHYDCVRWGAVAAVVTDFFGAGDESLAPAPADGAALARIQTTHVVAADWALQTPTPRGPNDGTPWSPPDAGPIPDAGPVADAGPTLDAAPRPDATPPPDAAPLADAANDTYLDVTPAGGATCSCRAASRAPAPGVPAAPLGIAALALLRLTGSRGRRRR
jgi:hypothetical protein